MTCSNHGKHDMNYDVVNSPKHYTQGKYETIDVIMDVAQHLSGKEGYLVGNIIKYLSRYHFKNGVQDLEKSQWYLKKLIEVIKNEGLCNGEERTNS